MIAIPFLVALQAVVIAPPAPPAPPVISAPMRRIVDPGAGPRGTQALTVQLRQDGHVLWSGDMTRASDGMASFTQQLRESRVCAGTDPRPGFDRAGVWNTSVSVSVMPDYPATDSAVRVSVERTRPFGDDAGCPDGGTSSTVRFEARTILPQGKPITLSGEGGLSVTITRR